MGTTLKGCPAIAERIGYFFAEFAGLEWDLRWGFEHLFGFRQDLTDAFFRPREGTSSRIDAMFRFASALSPDDALSKCFRDIEERVKAVVRFRNVLAHGFITGAHDGTALLTSGKTRITLSNEVLDAQLAEMEELKRLLDRAWHAPRSDNFPRAPKRLNRQ